MVRTRGGGIVGSRRASTSVRAENDSSESVHVNVAEDIPHSNNVIVLSRRREHAPRPKTRGFTRGAEPPPNPDERPFIVFGSACFLEPEVRSRIGFLVKSHLPGPLAEWNEWSKEEKQVIWHKFLEYYQFKAEDLERAEKLLEMHIADNYRNWMYRAREDAKKRHGGDLSKSVNDPPEWIGTIKWQGLLKKWLTNEWADKSDAGKRNRAMSDGAVYTGGCRPVEQVALDMYKQTKQMPSHLELFEETHKTKTSKEWISARAKRIGEKYKSQLEENTSSDGPDKYNDPGYDVWKTVVGVKKGRLLGLGPRRKFNSFKLNASTTSSYLGMLRDDPIVKQLQDEVKELREKLGEKTSHFDALQAQFDTLQSHFAMLCGHIGYSLPFIAPTSQATTTVSTPSPTNAPTNTEAYIPSFDSFWG